MKSNILICTLSALLLSLSGSLMGADNFVWWEGEDFKGTNVADPVNMKLPGNAKKDQQAKLSGGRWMTPQGPEADGPYWITYQVDVPKDAKFQFWVRKFWKHGPFKWKFGNDDWREVTKNVSLADSTFLQKHWGANWVYIGEVELKKGTQDLRIEMTDKKGGGCFDCFILIDGSFTPRGKLKPGESSGLVEDGHFAWEPVTDPLNESPIDLRYLNEKVAGGDGFVKRKGDGFVLGNGEPVRFWMVQANLFNMDNKAVDRWARRLAKYGVNLVRMQMGHFFKNKVNGDTESFKKSLDRVHYVISALKKEGIYAYFGHIYWHTANPINDSVFPGFGKGKGKNAISLLFFSEKFQDWYKGLVKDIMKPKNPYTGKSLADEPAVAFFEIQNESSLLFYTFKPSRFPATELELIEKDFGNWLSKRYGSLDKAFAAWGRDKGKHTPDNKAAGRVGLYEAGFLGGADWAVNQRNPKRAGDQIEWMVESMKSFNDEMKKDFAKEIGMGQLITASNWKSTDPRVLGGLERYSYTGSDVVLRNSYYGCDYPKGGAQRFYAIELNDTCTYGSCLVPPRMAGPLATPHIEDFPYMVTENNWTRPNRFRAEWPFMIATYARMSGVDGWCFFALGSADWQHLMAVWDINNPTILGQFPAAALMFRRGDVSEPDEPAVYEKISMEDAYDLKGTSIFPVKGKDDLWVSKIGDKESQQATGYKVDPRAFFVGPVIQKYGDEKSEVKTVELRDYIDTNRKVINTVTGELSWNYGKGFATVNTPMAQGITGYLSKAGKITLGDVVIESQNEYGTILVVSLDGKPIKQSKKVLVQTATEDMPYGFRTKPQGQYKRITNLGSYPLNVKLIKATVSVKSKGKNVVVLDGNGYETDRKLKTSKGGDGLSITLPEDAIYTIIQ